MTGRVTALTTVLGIVLVGLQSLGLLPARWSNSQWAAFIEIALVVLGLAYLLLWAPYCSHVRSVEITAKLEQQLEANKAAQLEEKRGKLEVACNKEIEGCSVLSHSIARHYYRARVTLRCHQAVSGCFGRLIRIERLSANGIVREHEGNPLPFAPSDETNSTAKTLAPDVPEFLDILVVDFRPGVNRVWIAHEKGNVVAAMTVDNRYVFAEPGTYLVTVKMGGIGIPTQPSQFQFDWTGDHQTSELRVVGGTISSSTSGS